MNHPVLNAVARGETTKGELNQLRASGNIPAVIYGGGQAATRILLSAKEFLKATQGITESTIISLDIGGKKADAFVKARQRDVLTNAIIHVDFLEVVKGRLLHARVPLNLIGSAAGVRLGGILENPAHEVEVECDPTYLPERIEIDITELQVNHSIHVRDIAAIPNVKILTSPDLVVAVVKYAKAEVVEAPAVVPAADAAAAAAAPAAGAAPAGAATAAAPAATSATAKAASPGTSKREEKK